MDEDIPSVIKYFGERKKIFFVHFATYAATNGILRRPSTMKGRQICTRL
jgi:D-mannonate dehydratase